MIKVRPIAITGMGVICASGVGKEEFYEHFFSEKKIAVSEQEVAFFKEDYMLNIFAVPPFDQKKIPAKHRRRMSMLTKMIHVAADECLKSSSFDRGNMEDMGVVVATEWGEIQTVTNLLAQVTQKEEEEVVVSPTMFHNSVHNTAAGYLGIIWGIKGPTLTVSQGFHSFEAALESASLLIKMRQVDKVLVGTGDMFFDFAALDKCPDYDVLAAGSYFVFLESMESAQERTAGVLSNIYKLPSGDMRSKDYRAMFKKTLEKDFATTSIDIIYCNYFNKEDFGTKEDFVKQLGFEEAVVLPSFAANTPGSSGKSFYQPLLF